MLKITEESSMTDKTIVGVISYIFLVITGCLIIVCLSDRIGDFWALTLISLYSYALIFAIRVLAKFAN